MRKKLVALSMAVLMLAVAVIGGTLAYFTDQTETKVNTFTVGNVNIELTEPQWKGDNHNLMPGASYAKDPTITLAKEGDNFENKADSEDAWVFMKVEMNKFNSWLRLLAIENDDAEGGKYDLFGFVDNCEKCAAKYGKCQGHLNEAGLKALFADNAEFNKVLGTWFGGLNTGWVVMNGDEVVKSIVASWTNSSIKVIDPIVGYKTVLKAGESQTLFTSVTMPGTISTDDLAYSRFNTTEKDWELKFTGYAIQAENIADLQTAYSNLFPTAETFAFAD